jgi:hypothetical protein
MVQTYDVLFPLLASQTQYAQGSTISLDDADANTIQMLGVGVIVLSSAANAAALVTADEADTTAEDAGPGQAKVAAGEHD